MNQIRIYLLFFFVRLFLYLLLCSCFVQSICMKIQKIPCKDTPLEGLIQSLECMKFHCIFEDSEEGNNNFT